MTLNITFSKAGFILIKMYYDEQSWLKRQKGRNNEEVLKLGENVCAEIKYLLKWAEGTDNPLTLPIHKKGSTSHNTSDSKSNKYKSK